MRTLQSLPNDARGVAFAEFALSLPIFLLVLMGGAEIANYMTTRMRVSQLALHIADHAARLGEGSPLAAKQLSEKQINNVLEGAKAQAAELDLYGRGRVILSSLEPVDTPNTRSKYKIAWQRCRGSLSHTPTYGTAGPAELDGMGPSVQVPALENGATMFVEIRYDYKPLLMYNTVPFADFTEIATMAVRDRRDRTRIWNNEGATIYNC